jgi:hypothetical protein
VDELTSRLRDESEENASLGRNSPIFKNYSKLKILVLLPVSTMPYVVVVKNYSLIGE